MLGHVLTGFGPEAVVTDSDKILLLWSSILYVTKPETFFGTWFSLVHHCPMLQPCHTLGDMHTSPGKGSKSQLIELIRSLPGNSVVHLTKTFSLG